MKKKEKQEACETAQMRSEMTDPQGCYTGVPADPEEVPVQDADDL